MYPEWRYAFSHCFLVIILQFAEVERFKTSGKLLSIWTFGVPASDLQLGLTNTRVCCLLTVRLGQKITNGLSWNFVEPVDLTGIWNCNGVQSY